MNTVHCRWPRRAPATYCIPVLRISMAHPAHLPVATCATYRRHVQVSKREKAGQRTASKRPVGWTGARSATGPLRVTRSPGREVRRRNVDAHAIGHGAWSISAAATSRPRLTVPPRAGGGSALGGRRRDTLPTRRPGKTPGVPRAVDIEGTQLRSHQWGPTSYWSRRASSRPIGRGCNS